MGVCVFLFFCYKNDENNLTFYYFLFESITLERFDYQKAYQGAICTRICLVDSSLGMKHPVIVCTSDCTSINHGWLPILQLRL